MQETREPDLDFVHNVRPLRYARRKNTPLWQTDSRKEPIPRRLFHDGFIFFSVASLDLEHFGSDAYSIDSPPDASVHLCLYPCYLTRFISAFYQNQEMSTRELKLQKYLWDEDTFSQVLSVYWKQWGITKNEIIRLGNYPVS
jgi:hypothetical protein